MPEEKPKEEKKESKETLEQKFEQASKLLYAEKPTQETANGYLKEMRGIKRELNKLLKNLDITVDSDQPKINFSQGFKDGCMSLWNGMIASSVNGNSMTEFECARELYDIIDPYAHTK